MIAAQNEAKRFINWLERYNHSEYDNLGQALNIWCVADDGVSRLGFDYALFLQMVIAVLVTEKGLLRSGINVAKNEYKDIYLPNAFDGWLPDRDDFQAAVVEAKARQVARIAGN